MKKFLLSIYALALVATGNAQKLDRSVRPKAGPAPQITMGKIDKFILPNGLRVFVVENHKLPVISCSIQLDIKPELEGAMAGYREMMAELLTSGTKTRSNDKLNQEIDFIGANISASDQSVYGSSLKKHQDKLLELISDITINTDIKQEELDKVKKRALSGLEAAKNEPDQMAENVSSALNFGAKHPYGQVATEATVSKVTLAQCRKYFSTYFRPNVAYMAIVGDVTAAELKPLITKYFGGWQKADVPVTAYSNPEPPSKTGLAFVPREGAVQSVINVTYPIDLYPGSADVIKTKVLNSLLGGGSIGHLFLNLREKHGWTYGSYSSINQDELKGHFTAYAKCRNAVTDSSVGEILNEMKALRDKKVDKDELAAHIAYLSGSFAIGLESPQTVAQYAINIERYKMPENYYQDYLKNLAAVTPEDVQDMARKYLSVEKANIVVVGSKGDVDQTLAKFSTDGTVAYYDNYGNPLKTAEQKAMPSNITAADVMKKYIASIGGEKAISSIKDIKMISKGEIGFSGQNIPVTITAMKKTPAHMKIAFEGMGMILMKQVLNGDKAYLEAGGQKKDLEGADLEDLKEEADIAADLHPEKYKIVRTLKGMEKLNNKDAYLLDVDLNGKKASEYYDVQTGYLLKKVEASEEGTQTTEFSDYKEVAGSGGYKVPYTIKINAGPQTVNATVQTVEVNKNIPDSEFN